MDLIENPNELFLGLSEGSLTFRKCDFLVLPCFEYKLPCFEHNPEDGGTREFLVLFMGEKQNYFKIGLKHDLVLAVFKF